jgi:hypothetical protein
VEHSTVRFYPAGGEIGAEGVGVPLIMLNQLEAQKEDAVNSGV